MEKYKIKLYDFKRAYEIEGDVLPMKVNHMTRLFK